jgi:glycosyltransferase involved in cell wall biosynthesis
MTGPRHRILLTNSSSLYAGGEFYVLELARTLVARGHGVLVACPSGNLLTEKCLAAGVPTAAVEFPANGALLRHIRLLRSLLREHGAAILHSNTNYDRTAGAFAAKLEGAFHVTNVHSFHSISHNLTHAVRNRWATDHFLVDGVCVKDLLVREDRIDQAKISVLHLGVDPAAMRRDPGARRAVRASFGIADGQVVIGNVGRLVPFKGQEDLLRAFAQVARVGPEARLVLVGDGELRQRLGELAAELGVAGSVVFAGFRDDLVAVYSAFDIYCHSSVEGGGETFPFAVLQALSQELPVVVTRVGDVAVMVEEGVNGHVLPDRDPGALAHALTRLLADPDRAAAMGRASRALLVRRFTTDAMVDVVERLYDSLSTRRRR